MHLIPTKVLMEGHDEHYEVSLFLDNALYSDYRLVTFYLRWLFGLRVPLTDKSCPRQTCCSVRCVGGIKVTLHLTKCKPRWTEKFILYLKKSNSNTTDHYDSLLMLHVMCMTANISIVIPVLSYTCVNKYGYGLFVLRMFGKMYIHVDS